MLAAYGKVRLLRDKNLDVLKDLERRLGFRAKLQDIARAALGKAKAGPGPDAVMWWRAGDPVLQRRVVDYCRMDMELLRDIVAQGAARASSKFLPWAKIGRCT